MVFVNDILSRRKEQLDLQEKIDDNLKKYVSICPKQILGLLLYEREINRDFTKKMNNWNPVEIYNEVKNNMGFYDKFYDKLSKFKCDNDN